MKYISLFTFLLVLIVIVLLILILLKKKHLQVENFSTQSTLTIDLGTKLRKPAPIPSTENFKELVKKYYGDNANDKTTVVVNYGFITTWDTSQVTDMSSAFNQGFGFNGNFNQDFRQSNDINTKIVKYKDSDGNEKEYIAWDTKNVTNMSNMFGWANSGDITKWNTSKVTNMQKMFYFCDSFNQNINTSKVTVNGETYTAWDTKNVTDMSMMFYTANATNEFNGDISNWDTSNVTNMGNMFHRAKNFNSDISTKFVQGVRVLPNGLFQSYIAWDTKNVTDMSYMFLNNYIFNANISNWNTSNVKNMRSMFAHCWEFNQNINTSKKTVKDKTYTAWDVSQVTDMEGMFSSAKKFNQPLSRWDVSNVRKWRMMFRGANVFNQDITHWKVTWKEYRPQLMFTRIWPPYANPSDFPFIDRFRFRNGVEVIKEDGTPTSEFFNQPVPFTTPSTTPTTTTIPKPTFIYNNITNNRYLCGKEESPNTKMEWKGVDCGNNNIEWQSMKSVDNRINNKTLEQCSWTRQQYDENEGWNENWLGQCGVAPLEVPDLPKNFAELYPTTISTTTTNPITTSITTTEDPTTTLTTPITTSTTTTTPTTISTTTTTPAPTTTTILPMCRFIPNGESYDGCVAKCLSPRNKNFGGDLCNRNICEAKCSECKNSNLCKWLIQNEYSNDKIKLEGIEGNKRVQLYWNLNAITVGDLKEFIIYYKNTYTDNINADISIKTIPFKQNKKNYSIVIDNLDNSTDYSFVINVVNKTNNIEYISNTINLTPNSITQLIL